MVKSVTFKEAETSEKEKYNKHKEGKSFSICDKLHNEYKEFCFNTMKKDDMSRRIRINMVRDMLENKK